MQTKIAAVDASTQNFNHGFKPFGQMPQSPPISRNNIILPQQHSLQFQKAYASNDFLQMNNNTDGQSLANNYSMMQPANSSLMQYQSNLPKLIAGGGGHNNLQLTQSQNNLQTQSAQKQQLNNSSLFRPTSITNLSEYQKYSMMLPPRHAQNNMGGGVGISNGTINAVNFVQNRLAVKQKHANTMELNNNNASQLLANSKGDLSNSDISLLLGVNGGRSSLAPVDMPKQNGLITTQSPQNLTNNNMILKSNILKDLKQQRKAMHDIMTKTQEKLLFQQTLPSIPQSNNHGSDFSSTMLNKQPFFPGGYQSAPGQAPTIFPSNTHPTSPSMRYGNSQTPVHKLSNNGQQLPPTANQHLSSHTLNDYSNIQPQKPLQYQEETSIGSKSTVQQSPKKLSMGGSTPSYKRNLYINTQLNQYVPTAIQNQNIQNQRNSVTLTNESNQKPTMQYYTPQNINNVSNQKDLPLLTDYVHNKNNPMSNKSLQQKMIIQQNQQHIQLNQHQLGRSQYLPSAFNPQSRAQAQANLRVQVPQKTTANLTYSHPLQQVQQISTIAGHPQQKLIMLPHGTNSQQSPFVPYTQKQQQINLPALVDDSTPPIIKKLQIAKQDTQETIKSSEKQQVELLQEILNIVTEQQKQQSLFFQQTLQSQSMSASVNVNPNQNISQNPSMFLPLMSSANNTPTTLDGSKMKNGQLNNAAENGQKKISRDEMLFVDTNSSMVSLPIKDAISAIDPQRKSLETDSQIANIIKQQQQIDKVFVNSGKISQSQISQDKTEDVTLPSQEKHVQTRKYEESTDLPSSKDVKRVGTESNSPSNNRKSFVLETGNLLVEQIKKKRFSMLKSGELKASAAGQVNKESMLGIGTPKLITKKSVKKRMKFSTKTLEAYLDQELPIVHETTSSNTKNEAPTNRDATALIEAEQRKDLQATSKQELNHNSQHTNEVIKDESKVVESQRNKTPMAQVNEEDEDDTKKANKDTLKIMAIPYSNQYNNSNYGTPNEKKSNTATPDKVHQPIIPVGALGFQSSFLLQSKAADLNNRSHENGRTPPRKIESEQVVTYSNLLKISSPNNINNQKKKDGEESQDSVSDRQLSNKSGITKRSPMTFDPHEQTKGAHLSSSTLGTIVNPFRVQGRTPDINVEEPSDHQSVVSKMPFGPATNNNNNNIQYDPETGIPEVDFTISALSKKQKQKLLGTDGSQSNRSTSRKTSHQQIGFLGHNLLNKNALNEGLRRKSTVIVQKNEQMSPASQGDSLLHSFQDNRSQVGIRNNPVFNPMPYSMNRQTTAMGNPLNQTVNLNRQTTSMTHLTHVTHVTNAAPQQPVHESKPKAPPHRGKNSSSKLIFAQNVLSKIKKKEEKKTQAVQEETNEGDEKGSGEAKSEHSQAPQVDEELLEMEKTMPKPPRGKRRFIDYLLKKKDTKLNESSHSPAITQRGASQTVATVNTEGDHTARASARKKSHDGKKTYSLFQQNKSSTKAGGGGGTTALSSNQGSSKGNK